MNNIDYVVSNKNKFKADLTGMTKQNIINTFCPNDFGLEEELCSDDCHQCWGNKAIERKKSNQHLRKINYIIDIICQDNACSEKRTKNIRIETHKSKEEVKLLVEKMHSSSYVYRVNVNVYEEAEYIQRIQEIKLEE